MEDSYLEMYEYDNDVDNGQSGSVHEKSTDGTPSACWRAPESKSLAAQAAEERKGTEYCKVK